MVQESQLHNSLALDLIRSAAKEYNNSEYKFYTNGFFKYKVEGEHTLCIEDIYITPEFRGTPVSKMIMEGFYKFMQDSKIIMYYGRVFLNSPNYTKRIATFEKWGMKNVGVINGLYTIVQGSVTHEE